MVTRFSRLITLGLLLLMMSLASKASSQVLVYRLEFGEGKGINYHTYEGGYFAVPLLGGTGSFLLTSTVTTHTYVQAADSGKLFTALNGNDKKSVMSATTGSGTAKGAIVALGDVNHVIRVESPTYTLSAKIAKTLTGTAVTADDESGVTQTETSTGVGSAGVSSFKMIFDENQTSTANGLGLTLAKTLDQLILQLKTDGFTAEATTSTGTTGTTTTGTTGTTTTGTTTTGTTTTGTTGTTTTTTN